MSESAMKRSMRMRARNIQGGLPHERIASKHSRMDVVAQTRALRERSQRLTVEFLHADLDYAHTLCRLAKRTPERLAERLHAAQTALDAATRFMWKANFKPSELEELTAKVERLRFELESVGAKVGY
jgi:hypothetical protein